MYVDCGGGFWHIHKRLDHITWISSEGNLKQYKVAKGNVVLNTVLCVEAFYQFAHMNYNTLTTLL